MCRSHLKKTTVALIAFGLALSVPAGFAEASDGSTLQARAALRRQERLIQRSPRSPQTRQQLREQRIARRLLRQQAVRRQPAPVTAVATFSDQVFDLTNKERVKAGLKALKRNSLLDKAAQAHAVDMDRNDYFNHTDLKGGRAGDRIKKTGYAFVTAGENIAKGQETAEKVVRDWMNSPPHKENIMNATYDEIGVGVAGQTWVQNFALNLQSYEAPAESAEELLLLVNTERYRNNAIALQMQPKLTAVADAVAANMRAQKTFVYENADGEDTQEQLRRNGHITGSRNYMIAQLAGAGATAADQVLDLWMDSADEKAIIIKPEFRSVGIGIDGVYWFMILSD